MKKPIALLLFSLTFFFCHSQQKYPVTYSQLKEFEGIYEYSNKTTIKIAASPKDTLLYAIINESRYALRPAGKDLFLNMSNEEIHSFRNNSNTIISFGEGKNRFNLLSREVNFPMGRLK